MSFTPRDDEIVEITDEGDGAIQALLDLASSARFYRSPEGRIYAGVKVGDRYEIYGLNSSGFRGWLINEYFVDHPEPPSRWAIRRVVDVLEAWARFVGDTSPVFIRVGHDQDGDGSVSTCYLDLGGPSGRAIQIRVDGWTVVDRPRVHFRRPDGQLPLPMPSREGSIDLLRPYVNLDDGDFRLLIAWLTAALRPVGPYPILALHGNTESAKSTLAKVLGRLIDPQACPLLAPPRNPRDLMVIADNGWLLVFDHISRIPDWLSDSLCRLGSGKRSVARTFFSSVEQSVSHAQRPVILNGIEDFVRRGDLIEQTVFLHLPPILATTRRSEREYWRSFHADYPRILGGVLDTVVAGLNGKRG
jgi:hypothetical protein